MQDPSDNDEDQDEESDQFLQNPNQSAMNFSRWFSDLDWRLLLLIIPPLSLLLFLSLSPPSSNPFSSLAGESGGGGDGDVGGKVMAPELKDSRIAVCLVGGARRFELTGPSIMQMILKQYPNSDLFLHSPMDQNSYKFSLLKNQKRIAYVRIFEAKPIPETQSEIRVLTASNSPNGIQGLLQYFNLVEGCLTMIEAYQKQNNFTYDWIVRTRVDGYWNAPLSPKNFVPGKYLVPPGSTFGGLNDRLGIGDFNVSAVALSRLSMIPELETAGFRGLNSETSFRAQLKIRNVEYITERLPFCIVTDRRYSYPPARYGVPVAALSSQGPLSGAKCRPCTPVCKGPCVANVMMSLQKGWSWTNYDNDSLQLCNAQGEWEKGWEKIFDQVAGKKLAQRRKTVGKLRLKECVGDFEKMKNRTANWETPPILEICGLGLGAI